MQSFTSHGKVILSGEHSVVYGYPAIVCPADQVVSVTLEEKKHSDQDPFLRNILSVFQKKYKIYPKELHPIIESSVPIGSGLGSSAATAAAVFQALLHWFDITYTNTELFDLVQESEKFAHGKPSGVDATAVVYQRLIEFRRAEDKMKWDVLTDKASLPKFLLIQSGIPIESTKEMVTYVEQTEKKNEILAEIGKVTQEISTHLKNGLFEMSLISRNERLLEKLGVVSEKAKKIIREIESVGGFAKIAGAGGRKEGAGVIIVFHSDLEIIKELAKKSQWEVLS